VKPEISIFVEAKLYAIKLSSEFKNDMINLLWMDRVLKELFRSPSIVRIRAIFEKLYTLHTIGGL